MLVEMFDNHYINIIEKTSGIAPKSLGDTFSPENDEETVNILSKHENHLCASKIKRNQNDTLNFEFLTTKVEEINKIIKRLGQMVFL